MTEQLKPCPFTGEKPKHGLTKGSRDMHGDLNQNYQVWTKYSRITAADKERAFEIWNTRPSASREIAVKPLVWGRAEADGMNLQADCAFGRYYIALRANEGWFWWRPASSPAHQGCEKSEDEAKAAVEADYKRRIRSAIDTTPGNTDPMLIAKYDDELRKVRGRIQPDWEGFGRAITEDWPTGDIDGSDLFDMSLKYGLIAEIPGGYNPDEHIDAEGICPERGDPWYEYTFRSDPTEQPSVRDAARVLLDYLPNYAMENAALESRARDDEGEFASLSDLLDFSGQNKAYTVVREALAAALRSLAQEGE